MCGCDAKALLRLLPHCELYAAQQFPGRTAEESLSLSGNNAERSSTFSSGALHKISHNTNRSRKSLLHVIALPPQVCVCVFHLCSSTYPGPIDVLSLIESPAPHW